MKPVEFAAANRTLTAPEGLENCDPVPCYVDDVMGEFYSCWKPDANDLAAIANGAPIMLRVLGMQPPVEVYAGNVPPRADVSEERIWSIAKVVHDANRAYCQTLGDHSQAPFHSAPQWQVASVVDGVRFKIASPSSTPRDSHDNWTRVKLADGWVYGPVKDPEAKTHYCLVDYDALPLEQRRKDALFQAIITALLSE